jgi:hypothetical protein
MEPVCVRRGQGEIRVVTHDGRVFAAPGSSVNGHKVTAYTRKRQGRIILTRWDDSTMLATRRVPSDPSTPHRRLRPSRNCGYVP